MISLHRNISTLLVLLAGLCISLSSFAVGDSFQQRLEVKFPQAKGAKIEKAFPGFWSVVLNGDVVFFSDDLTIFINGEVFDLKNNESITGRIRFSNLRKIDVAELPLKDAIKMGSGTRKLYVFSDPDCRFCKELERVLNQLQDTEIYIFPLPLVEIHANARVIAESIWCQQNQGQAWRAYLDTQTAPAFKTCDNPISRNLALAGKLQIYGTPAVIFEDGRVFPGAMTLEQINSVFKSLGQSK